MYDRDLSVKTEFNCHKEASDFFGMYQRGAPLDQLRSDIGVPDYVLQHWTSLCHQEGDRTAYEALRVMVPYRVKVLERFDALVEGRELPRIDRRGRQRAAVVS